MEQNLKVTEFYDLDTHTFTYVVHDEVTGDAIVIDPVKDGIEKDFVSASNLHLRAILETHVHADHMTGSLQLKKAFPQAVLCIGERITEVQRIFSEKLGLKDFKADGSQFDHLLKDHENITFGSIQVKALPTPGHTPCCMSYLIGESVFTGDALFMPDFGTGRCDFPGGSAKALYHSVNHVLYGLPDHMTVYVGHDYCPNGRELAFKTTIGESREQNIHIKSETSESDYVSFREARDRTLDPPKNLERNIAFNMCAGKL